MRFNPRKYFKKIVTFAMIFLKNFCILLIVFSSLHGKTQERIFFNPPEGWTQIKSDHTEILSTYYYLPSSQNLDNWSDILVLQHLHKMTALLPSTVLNTTISFYKNICSLVQHNTLQRGVINGFQSAFWVISCGKNNFTPFGEVSSYLFIQGNQSAYILQRSWRVEAFQNTPASLSKEELAIGIADMQKLFICDDRTKDHPCLGQDSQEIFDPP